MIVLPLCVSVFKWNSLLYIFCLISIEPTEYKYTMFICNLFLCIIKEVLNIFMQCNHVRGQKQMQSSITQAE